MPIPFAECIRRLRANHGVLMGDQAEALGVSVAFISAIECGKKGVPNDYVGRVSEWLQLSFTDHKELLAAAEASSKVVKLHPATPETAVLAHGLAKRLNELSPSEIKDLRKLIERMDQDADQ